MLKEPNAKRGSLLKAVIGDIHLWIPLIVLVVGLILLHSLR